MIYEMLPIHIRLHYCHIVKIRAYQSDIRAPAHIFYHIRNFLTSVITYGCATLFNDTCFHPRNLFESVAKIFRMFKTYIGYNCNLWSRNNIGAVSSTSHANLHDNNIAVHSCKMYYSYSCQQLKRTWIV